MARAVWAIDGSGATRRAAVDELRSAAPDVARSSSTKPRCRRLRRCRSRGAHAGLGAAARLARRRARVVAAGEALHRFDPVERQSIPAGGAGPIRRITLPALAFSGGLSPLQAGP